MPGETTSAANVTTSGTPDVVTRQRLNQGAVLAWATVYAIGSRGTSTVKRVFIAQMQAFFNNVLPVVSNAVGTRLSPVTSDGVWGPKTAQAAIALIATGGSHSGDLDAQLRDSGFYEAFRIVDGTSRLSTESSVTSSFPAIRDAISIFSTQSGQRGGFAIYQPGMDLYNVVRAKATASEMTLATTQYLTTALEASASGVRVPVNIAQTAITQAAVTPSVSMPIVPGVAPETVVDFGDPATGGGENVRGHRSSRGPNLAIILPSIAVGGVLLVWLYKRRHKR